MYWVNQSYTALSSPTFCIPLRMHCCLLLSSSRLVESPWSWPITTHGSRFSRSWGISVVRPRDESSGGVPCCCYFKNKPPVWRKCHLGDVVCFTRRLSYDKGRLYLASYFKIFLSLASFLQLKSTFWRVGCFSCWSISFEIGICAGA